MKIIISPAKKMIVDTDSLPVRSEPVFLEDTEKIKKYIQTLSYGEAKKLWSCNDKIAELNFARFREMDLQKNLTPAILSYEGIQYQYMAPIVFTDNALSYIQEHLCILSGFYGVLKPLDGVVPYRVEMQAKAGVEGADDLYDFWGSKIYGNVCDKDRIIINLASKEYSKCVEHYLKPEDIFITCVFGELREGRVIQKGTLAKMARGEMVRYMAENNVTDLEQLKSFEGLGYRYEKEISGEKEYIFLKTGMRFLINKSNHSWTKFMICTVLHGSHPGCVFEHS